MLAQQRREPSREVGLIADYASLSCSARALTCTLVSQSEFIQNEIIFSLVADQFYL